MVEHIPKWVMQRYSKLWSKFGEKKFSYEDAEEALKESDNRILSVFLSELKKAGWVAIELDPVDSRKRLYKLINPKKAIEEEIKELSKK